MSAQIAAEQPGHGMRTPVEPAGAGNALLAARWGETVGLEYRVEQVAGAPELTALLSRLGEEDWDLVGLTAHDGNLLVILRRVAAAKPPEHPVGFLGVQANGPA